MTITHRFTYSDLPIFIDCPEEHMFPCVVTPPNEPYCVSELQFCDGVSDCPDGSDEPVDCARGKYNLKITAVKATFMKCTMNI